MAESIYFVRDVGYLEIILPFICICFSDIRDIHDIVEITVYDEDKDHKYEFLGRVQIPLLRVKNGERNWLKLKDKTLRKKAKGEEAEILVELNLFWNP